MVQYKDVCKNFEKISFDALLNHLGYSDIIVLENPIFTYPHKINTESCGVEITINMLNKQSRYEVDRIGFAWDDDVKQFDLVQASIKKSAFDTLTPKHVNSAKLLGYGFVNDRYLNDLGIQWTKKLREIPGEFEHIKNTTTYEFLEQLGLLSDTYHNAFIVESEMDNNGRKRSGKSNCSNVLEKDLKTNGVNIYYRQDIFGKQVNYRSTTNLEGLIIPDNEMYLVNSIKGMLSSKGCWTDEMDTYLTKIDSTIEFTS
ncbi:MAG: hypothetical protein GQ477_02255 [Nanohaloarchaea archaeon]|nr:hypothetical protein [Candidatus Nanohaloarchaea archaeon]